MMSAFIWGVSLAKEHIGGEKDVRDLYSPTCSKWESAKRKLCARDLFLHIMKENWFHMETYCCFRHESPWPAELIYPFANQDSWMAHGSCGFCPDPLASCDAPRGCHWRRPAGRKIHMHFRRETVYLFDKVFCRYYHYFLRYGIWGRAVQRLLCWRNRKCIQHA